MPRYKLTIEYDGNGLAGWQKQDGQATVQGQLEEAIFKFCGEHAPLLCAGRTDAGVHARGQVAHLDLVKPHSPFTVLRAINFHLIGQRIAIVEAEEAPGEFSCAIFGHGAALPLQHPQPSRPGCAGYGLCLSNPHPARCGCDGGSSKPAHRPSRFQQLSGFGLPVEITSQNAGPAGRESRRE